MYEPIKRLEIITDFVFVNKFTACLDEVGVEGYSIIKDVLGKGSSGNKDGHGVMAGFKNCLIIVCCKPDELDAIGRAITPLLKRFGGLSVVSDAQMIAHK